MITLTGVGLAAAAVMMLPDAATGYPQYRQSDAGGNCVTCHGDFTGPMSPQGTVFPGDDKHQMHRSAQEMNTDCGLCHTSTGDNPMLGSSAGSGSTPGYGCVGCHGRDYGGDIGVSGVGLRAHHQNAGVNACMVCHPDDPPPLPERFPPPYYGTGETAADDSCNMSPGFLENWSIGDTQGLDNDGDLAYDMNDGDCSCPADFNESGEVDIVDLLGTLGAWGGSDPVFDIAPFPGDGSVDILDLLDTLAAWGSCPG
jgi:hypothetical protein